MLIRKVLQDDLYIILIFQTVFQHIELEHTYNAHDDLFHTGIVFLEDLDRAFLGDLVDALDELFSLHRIHLAHSGEMFRRKGRDAFIGKLLLRCGQRVSDRENARVKDADDISSVCFVYDLPLARHHLLGLGKTHILAALDMVHGHPRVELAGTDPHERDPVPVGFVHIRLDLKYKS